MKKKILLIVLSSFMIMGVVSAASVWGNYKGYNKLKLIISGKEYTGSSVPTILVNGTPMIPVSSLKSLGQSYSYDSSKMTITINPLTNNSTKDISELKLYGEAADTFNKLRKLADSYHYLNMDFYITAAHLPNNATDGLNSNNVSLNDFINSYNGVLQSAIAVEYKLRDSGLTQAADDINTIIDKFNESINSYKSAYQALSNYNTDANYFNSYIKFDTSGSTAVIDALKLCDVNFDTFQYMIKNYKPVTSTPSSSISTSPVTIVPVVTSPSVINSRIDGDFDGFEYDNVYKLQNGQLWKQTSFDLKLSLKLSPKVTIYKDGSYYYMMVDGVDKKVKVQLIQ